MKHLDVINDFLRLAVCILGLWAVPEFIRQTKDVIRDLTDRSLYE